MVRLTYKPAGGHNSEVFIIIFFSIPSKWKVIENSMNEKSLGGMEHLLI